jgi:hypothetical protein
MMALASDKKRMGRTSPCGDIQNERKR